MSKRRPGGDSELDDSSPDALISEPVPLPLDGRLDLHPFHPRDVKPLLHEYLAECRAHGVLFVEIVHGKGTGALRRTVHSVLSKMPEIESFSTADEGRGGWGVTLVRLKPTS